MTKNTIIAIDPEVLAILNKKNKKILVLDIQKSGGGCCPTYEVTEISYRKPVDVTLYSASFVDDIEVYISNKVTVSAPVLRFSLEKRGLIKQIVAKGLSLKK